LPCGHAPEGDARLGCLFYGKNQKKTKNKKTKKEIVPAAKLWFEKTASLGKKMKGEGVFRRRRRAAKQEGGQG